MTDAGQPLPGRWRALRRRLVWVASSSVLIVALFVLAYLYFFVLGGSVGPPVLISTSECASYKVHTYLYSNDSGYQQLVDAKGTVLGSAKFSISIAAGPVRWQPGCRAVLLGSDEGTVVLKVPQ